MAECNCESRNCRARIGPVKDYVQKHAPKMPRGSHIGKHGSSKFLLLGELVPIDTGPEPVDANRLSTRVYAVHPCVVGHLLAPNTTLPLCLGSAASVSRAVPCKPAPIGTAQITLTVKTRGRRITLSVRRFRRTEAA